MTLETNAVIAVKLLQLISATFSLHVLRNRKCT